MIIRVKVKLREQDTLREPRVFKVAAIYYPSNNRVGKEFAAMLPSVHEIPHPLGEPWQ